MRQDEDNLVGLLPETVTTAIAALLVGVTEGRLRDIAFEEGRLRPTRSGPGCNWAWPVKDLGRYMGRELQPLDYLRALRQHSGRLEQFARANERRRAAR